MQFGDFSFLPLRQHVSEGGPLLAHMGNAVVSGLSTEVCSSLRGTSWECSCCPSLPWHRTGQSPLHSPRFCPSCFALGYLLFPCSCSLAHFSPHSMHSGYSTVNPFCSKKDYIHLFLVSINSVRYSVFLPWTPATQQQD